MPIDLIISEILRREAGYVDHPADRGGPTNMGITMDTLSSWRGRPVTVDDIKTLPQSEAIEIYQARYVLPWNFLEDEVLRALLIDWSVHSSQRSGVGPPTDAFQQFIKDAGIPVTVDGSLGPNTRNAWATLLVNNREQANRASNLLAKERQKFYIEIVLRDKDVKEFIRTHPKTQLRNLRGWNNRALEFL